MRFHLDSGQINQVPLKGKRKSDHAQDLQTVKFINPFITEPLAVFSLLINDNLGVIN